MKKIWVLNLKKELYKYLDRKIKEKWIVLVLDYFVLLFEKKYYDMSLLDL